MKLITVPICFVLLLSTNSVSAQCSKETDDFTGKTTVLAKKIKITHGGVPRILKSLDDGCTYKTYFQLISSNGKTYIAMSEDSDDCFCSPTEISFKFKDGKAIIKTEYSNGEGVKTQLGAEHLALFEITRDDLAEFATCLSSKMRIIESGCTDHPIIEEEVEDTIAAGIKASAACMVQSIGK